MKQGARMNVGKRWHEKGEKVAEAERSVSVSAFATMRDDVALCALVLHRPLLRTHRSRAPQRAALVHSSPHSSTSITSSRRFSTTLSTIALLCTFRSTPFLLRRLIA